MKTRIILNSASQTLANVTSLVSFTFRKEAYSPYTSLSASFFCDAQDLSAVSEVKLYIDEKLVHHGMADNITHSISNGKLCVSVSSRGFTSQLIQNQTEPGLRSDISINDILDGSYAFPHVTHEDNSDTSSYIFVKNHSTVWDGIVNLAYKLEDSYPFIAGTNHVRITPFSSPKHFSYPDSKLIERGERLATKRLISNFHMSDLDGSYGEFEYADPYAISKGIVRHCFFEFDKQFLYSPEDALVYRARFARRGTYCRFCVYPGYNGEDLTDLVTFAGASEKRICSIRITGEHGRISTELGVYTDGFYS